MKEGIISTGAERLLTSQELMDAAGISRSCLVRWVAEERIRPTQKRGVALLWHPCKVEEALAVKEVNRERMFAGRAVGLEKSLTDGLARAALEKGRESQRQFLDRLQSEGLYSKSALWQALGIHRDTLSRWIVEGIIKAGPRHGAIQFYHYPDAATLEKVKAQRESVPYHNLRLLDPQAAQAEIAERGLLTLAEIAKACGVGLTTFRGWMSRGWVPGPVVKVVGKPVRIYFAPLPEGTAAKIKAQVRADQAERGRSVTRTRWQARDAERVEGALNRIETAQRIGVSPKGVRDRLQRGELSEVKPGWIAESEVARYLEARKAKEEAAKAPKPPKAPKPITRTTVAKAPTTLTLPKIAPAVSPTPLGERSTPSPERPTPSPESGFVDYDTALSAGRANTAFHGPLGFNLLKHPRLGFRAALITEKPGQDWGYHERHAIGGLGRRWQVLSMKASGEVVR